MRVGGLRGNGRGAWQVAVGIYATIVNRNMFFEGAPAIVAMVRMIAFANSGTAVSLVNYNCENQL